jgi:hypothetical protein
LLARSAVGCLASVAILSGGSVSTSEPAAGPTKDALRLETVVARGCLQYLLGQKAEKDAMLGVGLNHIHPLPIGLEPGDNAPFWTSGLPGELRVNVGGEVCNVVLRGRDVAAYRAAAQRAVDLALGPGAANDAPSHYRQWVPGQITGCRRGIRYSYYEDKRRGRFSVELTRVACDRDPLRQAG